MWLRFRRGGPRPVVAEARPPPARPVVLKNSDALPGVAGLCYPNWRSFTEIERKWNARRRRTADSAQLAFAYRDMAEIERQKRPATGEDPTGGPMPMSTCSCHVLPRQQRLSGPGN